MNNPGKILISISIAAAAGWIIYNIARKKTNTMDNSNLPRGYRNNNPLNIRISSNAWQGKKTPNTDGAFEQFTSMAYGYRAAMVLIRTYINQYGLNTVQGIISRWAPNNENNTAGYISSVCRLTGYEPDTIISPTNKEQMCNLCYAMSIVENGYNPMPDRQAILQGWNLYS